MRVDLWPGMRDAALLAAVAGGTWTRYGRPTPPCGIAVDSRLVCPGDLFAALPGKQQNGRDFIASALERGAVAVLTDSMPAEPGFDCDVLTVPNVTTALLRWAAYRRQKTKARVIGVSGSAGKTTAKEGILHLCRTVGTASATVGNYNSTVGMPLSVLSFDETDFWVVEIGVNHPGEMAPMAAALAPDLAVLTNVGSAHIGNFKNKTALIEEKAALTCGMHGEGILLVPHGLYPLLPAVPPRVVTFGVGGDFEPLSVTQEENGVTLSVSGHGRVLDGLFWPLPGRAGEASLLLLAAVGMLLGLDEKNIRAGIAAAGKNTPRLRRYMLDERLLIDDAYNASPEATAAALETLRILAGDRPAVAVLGDMLELGDLSPALHEAVGEVAARTGLDRLYCCGRYAAATVAGARRAGMPGERIVCSDTVDVPCLARALSKNTPRNAVILFKASHAAGLGEVVRLMQSGDSR